MSRRGKLLLAFVLVVLAWPVLGFGQKLKVDYDKGIDFAKFKTFAWGELLPPRLPMLRINIVSAINEELKAKGLTEVDKNPDVIVTYTGDMAGEANRGVSAPTYPGFAGPAPTVDATMWSGGAGGAAVTYPKGTLIVELMDPHASKIAWRGVGEAKLDIEKKGKSVERINSMISKMFVHYPPQSEKK